MRFTHRIGLNIDPASQHDFKSVGVEVDLGFSVFEIYEDDARWHDVEAVAKKYGAFDFVGTDYTREEVSRASYLSLVSTWLNGYPQPEDDNGYLQRSYDLAAYCSICGTGARQVAPLRLKRPPVWGRRQMFQLNWIFDEHFVRSDVWESKFKPLGVTYWPVLLHKTGTEIDGVVQLRIEDLSAMDLSGLTYELCEGCGVRKYLPVTRGFQPQPIDCKSNIAKSSIYFGSGGSAFRQICVSNHAYKEMGLGELKGCAVHPCGPR